MFCRSLGVTDRACTEELAGSNSDRATDRRRLTESSNKRLVGDN